MRHAPRGHRSLPHTADVMIEAWGADLAACCEEAVAALAELYAEAGDAAVVAERELSVPPAPPGDMLLDLLDEVVFALDVAEGIPSRPAFTPVPTGASRRLRLADPASVEPAGAVPKAISRSGLKVTRAAGAVRCRFLVDV